MEHRWSERQPVREPVTIHCPWASVRTQAYDMSLGGVFVKTGAIQLPLNQVVVVAFALGGGLQVSYHRLRAVVVRTSDDGAGLMYLDSAPETLHPLRDALRGQATMPQAPGGGDTYLPGVALH